MSFERAAEQVKARTPGGQWPEPEQLGADITTQPPGPFPTDVTPPALRNMIRAVASNKQVPETLPALLGLAAAGILAGPRVAISRGHGWAEPLTIYAAVAMESGTGKSPAEADVTKPLRHIQRLIRANHEDAVTEAVRNLNEAMAAQISAKDTGGPDERRQAEKTIRSLKAQIEEAQAEVPPRILIGSDTTIEALGNIMAANGDHGGIMDGEGEFFAILSGRYTGQIPNLGLTLKAYDSAYYEVGRVGRSQRDMVRAVLGLGLAVQPIVLDDAAKSRAMRERGLLARFLFGVPPNLLGTRAPEGAPYDRAAMNHWAAVLEKIANIPIPLPDDDEFPALQLTRDAREMHIHYKAGLEPKLHPDDGELGDLPGWASKHIGRALRIAGLLHLLDGRGVEEPVDDEMMCSAIEIAQWAIPHAITVFGWDGPVFDEAEDSQCQDVLDWVRRRKPKEITTRVVCRGLRRAWVKNGGAAAVLSVLTRLVEMRWLAVDMRTDGAGRETVVYLPHPKLLTDEAA